MSRLTMKLDEPIKTKYLNYEYNRIPDYDIVRGNFGRISDDMIFNKLGKLEDLEDELNCDLKELLCLLLAYKQSYVYIKNAKDELVRVTIISQVGLTTDGEWCVVTNSGFILSKDYGKTWWLKGDLSE